MIGSYALQAQDYYTVQQIEQAKAKAREQHLPIAWLSSPIKYLDAAYANDNQGSAAELTNLALKTLQGQAVVIFQNADTDLPNMPANVVDRIETKDEGNNLPDGQHYTAPKIIYADPELTTFFECTLAPDLRAEREAAITVALLHIQNNPQSQMLIKGASKPPTTPVINQPSGNQRTSDFLSALMLATDFTRYFSFIAGVLIVVVAVLVYLAWRGRPPADPPESQ